MKVSLFFLCLFLISPLSYGGRKAVEKKQASFTLTEEYVRESDIFDNFKSFIQAPGSLACLYDRGIAASRTANAFVKMYCSGNIFEFVISSRHPSDGPTLKFGPMTNGIDIYSKYVDSFMISLLVEAGLEPSGFQKNLFVKKDSPSDDEPASTLGLSRDFVREQDLENFDRFEKLMASDSALMCFYESALGMSVTPYMIVTLFCGGQTIGFRIVPENQNTDEKFDLEPREFEKLVDSFIYSIFSESGLNESQQSRQFVRTLP